MVAEDSAASDIQRRFACERSFQPTKEFSMYMNVDQSRWTIDKVEHEDSLISARIDNIINSSALFTIAYIGLTSSSIVNTSPGYIRITMPIIMILISCVTQCQCLTSAVVIYTIRKRALRVLRRDKILHLPMTSILLLNQAILRAIVYPTCITLMWAFMLLDFTGGKPSYVIPVVGFLILVSIFMAGLFAVEILRTDVN